MANSNRGVLLAICGLLVLVASVAPLVVRSALQEIGRESPAETAGWQTIEAEGLRLRVPPTWFELTSEGHVLGLASGHLAAPLCSERPGDECRGEGTPPLELRWQVERVENRSTPSGDEVRARLEGRGFGAEAVTVRGLPATLLTAPEGYGSAIQVIVAEHDGVYYRFWLSGGLIAQNGSDLRALILGALELTPATAPLPFDAPVQAPANDMYLPLIRAGSRGALGATSVPTVINTESAQASAAPAQTVAVNLSSVAAYAEEYAEEPWPNELPNSDGCYVYTNNPNSTWKCGTSAIHTTPRDGAHFIDCALKAGRLTLGCNGDPNNPYVSMATLYGALKGLPHREISSAEARRGDIFVVSYSASNVACWGGIVLGRIGGNQLFAATHSIDKADLNPQAAFCDEDKTPVTRTYLRLNNDDAPPVARFTAPAAGLVPPGSLTISYSASDLPEASASGVASFAITRTLEGGTPELLDDDATALALDVFLDTPCRSITFSLSAVDNADNRGQEVLLALDVGLWGDADADNDVDDADLAAAEAAWGRQRGQLGYNSALDVNADDRIDATDLLWIERHRGDSCA